MPLPSSGPLSLNDIAGEFGGSTPHSLSEYYAGGGLVPSGTTGTNGAVPSSGAISIFNFYGTSNITYYIAVGTGPSGNAIQSFQVTDAGAPVFGARFTYTAAGYSTTVGSVRFATNLAADWNLFFTGFQVNASQGSHVSPDGANVYSFSTGGTTNSGTLVRMNSSGTAQWFRQTHVNAWVAVVGTQRYVDSSGNVHGLYRTTGVSPLTALSVLKVNTSGTEVWSSRLYQGPNQPYGVGGALTCSTAGDVWVFGDAGTSPTSYAAIRLNSSGNIQTQWRFTGLGTMPGNGYCEIATDSSANFYITTRGDGAQNGLFVFKYNSSGTFQWGNSLPSSNTYGFAPSITVDSSGNVYVLYAAADGVSGYVLKFNSSGTLQWARSTNTPTGSPHWVRVDGSGSVYVFVPLASNKFRVMKMPADGSKTGSYTVDGQSITWSSASISVTSVTPATASGSFTANSGGISVSVSSTPSTNTGTYTSVSSTI